MPSTLNIYLKRGVTDEVVERRVKIEVYLVYYKRTITFPSLCINNAVINEIVNFNTFASHILGYAVHVVIIHHHPPDI